MSKLFIQEETLSNIGSAIREKTGGSDLIAPGDMPGVIRSIETGGSVEALEITANGTYTAPDGIDGYNPITVNVPQDGAPTAEELILTGDCSYRFTNDGWNWVIEKYGNTITTKDITAAQYMFSGCVKLKTIPFDINFTPGTQIDCNQMFSRCNELINSPKLINCKPISLSSLFGNCRKIREIPEEVYNTWDWSYIDNQTSAYAGSMSNLFYECYSLRKLPMKILEHGNPVINNTQNNYYSLAGYCYSLDEIVDLPYPHINATWTSSAFSYNGDSFNNCYRLKNLTWKMPNGSPYVVNWKNQTISLQWSGYVPTTTQRNSVIGYNSGITADKEVKDDATYQALKNDPDWFSCDVAYSRYNHDSAVATINSLPDTSAYLATAGGTNTIKFKGAAGSATDGGAINTLTEEEIAVATAKGWTVSLV